MFRNDLATRIMNGASLCAAMFIIGGIRAYRRVASPLLSPRCRFYPTCSHYSEEAVARYGPLKGSIMAIARILRCNPLFPGGVDRVK